MPRPSKLPEEKCIPVSVLLPPDLARDLEAYRLRSNPPPGKSALLCALVREALEVRKQA